MGIFDIFRSGYSWETILVLLGAWFIAIIFAIVAHEFSHAFVANKMGDPTAKLAGRLSLNPVRHLDPLGAICLALFGFGWAKGVPINPNLFRNYRKGQVLVSLSGIITNLCLGIIFTFLSVIAQTFFDPNVLVLYFIQALFMYSAVLNYVLAVFNFLPIYPLDGFSLLEAFLPYENKFAMFMRKYGIIILLVLLVSGVIGLLINWVLQLLYTDLFALFKMMF